MLEPAKILECKKFTNSRPEGINGRYWYQYLKRESYKVMYLDKSSWQAEEPEVVDN